MKKQLIIVGIIIILLTVGLSGCNDVNKITKPSYEPKIVIKDYSIVVDQVDLDKFYIDRVDVLVKNEGDASTKVDLMVLSSGESKINFHFYLDTLGAGEEKNYSGTTYSESLPRTVGITQLEGKISLTRYSGEILAEKNITIQIPTMRVGDTIPDINLDNSNLSFTIVWWNESDIAVVGPYSGGYRTYLARTGFKFIVIAFEYKNNWIRQQFTPYLDSGEVVTDKGYIYSIWDWIYNYEEYESRESTQNEIDTLIGDSAGYKTLMQEESVVGCIVFEIPVNQTAIEISIDDVPAIIELE